MLGLKDEGPQGGHLAVPEIPHPHSRSQNAGLYAYPLIIFFDNSRRFYSLV